jgi:hypothetical protein
VLPDQPDSATVCETHTPFKAVCLGSTGDMGKKPPMPYCQGKAANRYSKGQMLNYQAKLHARHSAVLMPARQIFTKVIFVLPYKHCDAKPACANRNKITVDSKTRNDTSNHASDENQNLSVR